MGSQGEATPPNRGLVGEHWLERREAWALTVVLPLINCVTLVKTLFLSKPHSTEQVMELCYLSKSLRAKRLDFFHSKIQNSTLIPPLKNHHFHPKLVQLAKHRN